MLAGLGVSFLVGQPANEIGEAGGPNIKQPAVVSGAGAPPLLRANSSGPMSRTRTQRVHTTLLGRDDNAIRCPRVIRIGLLFDPQIDPVAQLETLLLMVRIDSPEDLRQRFRIPHGRLICRPFAGTERRVSVADRNRHRVLKQALMLGLAPKTLGKTWLLTIEDKWCRSWA